MHHRGLVVPRQLGRLGHVPVVLERLGRAQQGQEVHRAPPSVVGVVMVGPWVVERQRSCRSSPADHLRVGQRYLIRDFATTGIKYPAPDEGTREPLRHVHCYGYRRAT